MTGLRTWFDARTRREQRLLLAMAALAALTLVWAAIIRPVGDGLADGRARHADAVDRLGRAQAAAQAARRAARAGALTGILPERVRVEAEAAGLTLASLTPQGSDRVQIAIAAARPGVLLPWLARLEAQGMLVDAAALTDNGDRSVAANVTIKARGA